MVWTVRVYATYVYIHLCGTDKLLCTLKVAFNSRIGSELLCELPALSGGFFVSYVAHSCTTAGVPPVKSH